MADYDHNNGEEEFDSYEKKTFLDRLLGRLEVAFSFVAVFCFYGALISSIFLP